jgi:3-oxoacyl-[acyl-carrier protein] reductase
MTSTPRGILKVNAPSGNLTFSRKWLNTNVEVPPCASVVNIASSSGSLAIPGQSMYGTSKCAIGYLTKSLAAELAPDIRVNCIAPGPVDTPIHKTWAGDHVEEAYERMTSELPLKRMGTAEELAAWIVWLCSEQSGFVTGTVIPVDGGQTLPGALSRISK